MADQNYQTPNSSSKPAASREELIRRFGRLRVLDDLIRLRAADATQHPILAYPSSEHDAAAYEYFTGEDLDCLVDRAAQTLIDHGFTPPLEGESVVALLTLSDLNMVITFFALSRLGFTVMMLSPRLSATACVSLLEDAGCDTIIYGQTPSIRTTVGEILRSKMVTCHPMIQRELIKDMQNGRVIVLNGNRDPEKQSSRIAVIIHSAGSTGTPKPLFLTHKALMTHPLQGPGLTSFNSLPWYHLHGLSTALQAMWMRKIAFMWNASLPLTASGLAAALEAAQPESVQAVPYVFQLLADSPRGLDVLRKCTLVSYGGAPCPDELGDRLVSQGVRFAGSLGLTEAGLVAESISRPADDPYWNYMRFFDSIQPFVWMKPIDDAHFECVYLSGHPALTISNSNEPPGSFHSRDVFTPHPTLHGRWKHVTRLDDRITLVNGEKVLPLPMEGHIKQNPLVEDAVVVGIGKAAPGLLVFRSQGSKGISDEEYKRSIWPTVEEANARAEQFSQISRDMVAVLPLTAECPTSDKGSMIRDQVYQQYADTIEELYTASTQAAGQLELDRSGTESHLMKLCRDEIGVSIPSPGADFYTEGLDSLNAIHLRRLILRDFKIENSKAIGMNIVFEAGNVSRLAKRIRDIQNGQATTAEDELAIMANLVEKYSSFERHIPGPEPATAKRSIILTGATGSIGSHILFELLQDPSVSVVYCFTRREHPMSGVLDKLDEKDLHISLAQRQKIVALKTALHEPGFGLQKDQFEEMRQSVSLIIHTAWPVNFNIPLTSFEPLIKGVNNLINFSLSVNLPSPAVMLFCSSISATTGSHATDIPEAPMHDLTSALNMGYGRSKLVGENVVANARSAGARTYALRIGQVSGHSTKGLWNDTEALPLMVRSCLTLHALPSVSKYCSWIPVDKLASIILEIASRCSSHSPNRVSAQDSIYNLSNPLAFPWSSLLDNLRYDGFDFETVAFDTWLDKLRDSAHRHEEHVNPAVKLVDHYRAMYGQYDQTEESHHNTRKIFRTEKAQRDSEVFKDGVKIIEEGVLDCYSRDWLARWTKGL